MIEFPSNTLTFSVAVYVRVCLYFFLRYTSIARVIKGHKSKGCTCYAVYKNKATDVCLLVVKVVSVILF